MASGLGLAWPMLKKILSTSVPKLTTVQPSQLERRSASSASGQDANVPNLNEQADRLRHLTGAVSSSMFRPQSLSHATIDALRQGSPMNLAQAAYAQSLIKQPGLAFQSHPLFPSMVMRPGRPPPVEVNYQKFLSAVTQGNVSPLRENLNVLLSQLEPSNARLIHQVGEALRSQGMTLKHYAEQAYPVIYENGEAICRLEPDCEKVKALLPGQIAPEGEQSMDKTLYNMSSFSFFSVEPKGCGQEGKQSSRFGKNCYELDVAHNEYQLQSLSLFIRDFATMPQLGRALFEGLTGSTGSDTLDARVRSHHPENGWLELTQDELFEIGSAAQFKAENLSENTALSDAVKGYRFAKNADEMNDLLALEVQHRTASFLTTCSARIAELQDHGLTNSPAHLALGAALRQVQRALATPEAPGNLNLLMNHLGLRPQAIIPGGVLVKAPNS